jgi:hypothetical protein
MKIHSYIGGRVWKVELRMQQGMSGGYIKIVPKEICSKDVK